MVYSAPTYVPIELTGKCNLKCKHCYGGFPKEYPHELTTQDVFDIIDELYSFGVFRIELGGGEPTIRSDFFEIVNYALEHNDIELTIVTNGINWSESDIKNLAMMAHNNLAVHISMDGYDKVSYGYLRNSESAFDKVIRTTQLMIENAIDVRWNFALGKGTYRYLENVIQLANDIGVKAIRLMVLYNTGRAHDNELGFNFLEFQDFMVDYIENLRLIESVSITLALTQPFEFFVPLMERGYSFDEIQKKIPYASNCLQDKRFREQTNLGCVCGRMLGAINPLGNFYFCCLLTSNSDFSCDSLYSNSLQEIWENNELINWMRDLRLEDLNTNCYQCKYSDICGGGCRARAFYSSGDYLGADPLCPLVLTENKNKKNILDFKLQKDDIIDHDKRIIQKNNFINSFTFVLDNKTFRIRREEYGASVYRLHGSYFNINKQGYYILYKLYRGFSVEQIVAELLTIYNDSKYNLDELVRKYICEIVNKA